MQVMIHIVKVILNLRDDIVHRVIDRAAQCGQSLSQFVEQALEARVAEEEVKNMTVASWLDTAPVVPREAAEEMEAILGDSSFRQIDPGMWQS